MFVFYPRPLTRIPINPTQNEVQRGFNKRPVLGKVSSSLDDSLLHCKIQGHNSCVAELK